MTTTITPRTGLILLATECKTPPGRPIRPIGVVRRLWSLLGRTLQTLSVRNETPSEQAMRSMSSVDRPMR